MDFISNEVYIILFSSTEMNRSGSSDFWKNIFEEESLALRMPDIANHTGGISFDSKIYRRVKLTVSPASAYGDNFFSVVYLVQAILEDGATYRSFVKVVLLHTYHYFYMKFYFDNFCF